MARIVLIIQAMQIIVTYLVQNKLWIHLDENAHTLESLQLWIVIIRYTPTSKLDYSSDLQNTNQKFTMNKEVSPQLECRHQLHKSEIFHCEYYNLDLVHMHRESLQ